MILFLVGVSQDFHGIEQAEDAEAHPSVRDQRTGQHLHLRSHKVGGQRESQKGNLFDDSRIVNHLLVRDSDFSGYPQEPVL